MQPIHFCQGNNDDTDDDSVECEITFNGIIGQNTKLVMGSRIVIYPSTQVKLANIRDVKLEDLWKYNWGSIPSDNYDQLMALHKSGKYLACGIKSENEGQGAIHIVDVVRRRNGLIKGLTGMPRDVSFSVTLSPIFVGCVDEGGHIFVYEVRSEDYGDSLPCVLKTHITLGGISNTDPAHLLRWCPYLPEEDEDYVDVDCSRVFLAARKNEVEIWDLMSFEPNYKGYCTVESSNYFVTDMAMSPDGTTLAASTSAGIVKFYEIMYEDGICLISSCVHEVQPHDGNVLTCFLFLDTVGRTEKRSFWKFMITGSQGNRELKVWSCKTWACLQTIKFTSLCSSIILNFKAFMDPTTNNILLYDTMNGKLYLLEIMKEEHTASVFRVSEFTSPLPILSFRFKDTTVRYYNRKDLLLNTIRYETSRENATSMGNGEIERCYVIEGYVMLSNSLATCTLVYNRGPIIKKHKDPSNTMNNEQDQKTRQVMEGNVKDNREPLDLALKKVDGQSKGKIKDIKTDQNKEKVKLASSASGPSKEVEEMSPSGHTDKADHGHNDELIRDSKQHELQNLAKSLKIPDSLTKIVDKKNPVSKKKIDEFINKVNEKSEAAKKQKLEQESKYKTLRIALNLAKSLKMPDSLTNNEVERKVKNDDNDNSTFATEKERKNAILKHILEGQSKVEGMLESLSCKLDLNSRNEELLSKSVQVEKTIGNNPLLTSNTMKYVIQNEIRRNVIPDLKSEIDNLSEHTQRSIINEFRLSEGLMNEKINTSMQTISQALTEVLGKSLAVKLTPALENSTREEFLHNVIPKLDNIFNNAFKQLNFGIYKSVDTIIKNMESSLTDNTKDLVKNAMQMQTKSDVIMFEMNEALEGAKKVLCSTQETAVKLEKIGYQLLSATAKNANTQVPSVEFTESNLMDLIDAGDVVTAVEKVLNSDNGKLLSNLVRMLPVAQLFSEHRDLKQNVILSLIQKLASDLSSETDGRCRYMKWAITYLDPVDPFSKQHLTKIMGYAKRMISNFLVTNPSNPEVQCLRLLLIAIEGVLAKDH